MDEGKKKRLILIIVGAVVLVAAAIVLSFTYLSGRYDRNFDKAQLCYLDQNYAGAVEYLEKALNAEKTEEAYRLLAEVQNTSGNTAAAIRTLTAASLLFPDGQIPERLAELKAQQTPGAPDDMVVIGSQTVYRYADSIILKNEGLVSSDLAPITEFTELINLTLTENNLTDISALSGLSHLRTLYLDKNRITDLSPLSSLKELRTLYLDGNPLTDFTPLHTLTGLKTLSLRGITIGSNALDALKEALPNCSIFCDDVVEEVRELALGGLTFRSDVTELDLSGRNITDVSILSECTALTKLDLRNNHISNLKPLADLKALSWLCLWNNDVTDIKPLVTMPMLSYLDLEQNNITDISILAELKALKELYLSENKLKSLTSLKDLPALTRLSANKAELTDDDLTALRGIVTLTELQLNGNPELTGNALDALKEKLPNCTVTHDKAFYFVTFGETKFRSDVDSIKAPSCSVTNLKGLEHFENLKTLVLNDNAIYDISPLAELKKLEVLELNGNALSSLRPLKGLVTLKSLSLSGNDLTDISALENLTSLEYLELVDNRISDLTPLYGLTKLKELHISGNDMLSAEQLVTLSDLLPDCRIVTDLDLTPPSPIPEDGEENDTDSKPEKT